MSEFVAPEVVIVVHDEILSETSEPSFRPFHQSGDIHVHQIYNPGALKSATKEPNQTFEGEELYPDFYDKLAVLMSRIIKNHPFNDGNKRTAVSTVWYLLQQEGFVLDASGDELIEVALKVAKNEWDWKRVSSWLEDNVIQGEDPNGGWDFLGWFRQSILV